ncbi:type II secretion system protein [bacterium]|nr:type II secretion system protein [bacterium]
MIRFNKKRGFTLIELLVAMALFIALAAVGSMAIMKGIQAQRFEHNVREARTATRNALDRLADEMRAACPLPYKGNVTSIVSVSGVLFPDSYKDSYSTCSTGTDGKGKKYIYSNNRTIFTRLKDSSDPYDITNYTFVEWLVWNSDKNKVSHKNKISRRTYAETNKTYSDAGKYYTFYPDNSNVYARCRANLDSFVNLSKYDSYKNDVDLVAQLPGDYDEFTLTVSRNYYKDVAGSTSDYDLNNLNITLKALVHRPDYSGKKQYDDKKVEFEYSTRVNLQVSGNY